MLTQSTHPILQVEEVKRQKRDEAVVHNDHISGVKSITELISNLSAQATREQQEIIAIEIGHLHPCDIFVCMPLRNRSLLQK